MSAARGQRGDGMGLAGYPVGEERLYVTSMSMKGQLE